MSWPVLKTCKDLGPHLLPASSYNRNVQKRRRSVFSPRCVPFSGGKKSPPTPCSEEGRIGELPGRRAKETQKELEGMGVRGGGGGCG